MSPVFDSVMASGKIHRQSPMARHCAIRITGGEALAKNEAVRIAGFGTFATKNRPARTGRNPRTGEVVSIPASVAPAFRAGKALKGAVNGL